jgi:hypothetical protein
LAASVGGFVTNPVAIPFGAEAAGSVPLICVQRTRRRPAVGAFRGSLLWPRIDPDKALPWVAERLNLTFADSQTVAIRQALDCKVLVITGGPGVGKTTIVKAILRRQKGSSFCCAPPPAVPPNE